MCPWTVQGRWSIRNDVVALIKQVAPEVVSIHCVIHREALVAKKLGNEEKFPTSWCYFWVSIGVISGFRSKLLMQYCPKKSREFELVIEMGGDGHFLIILKCGGSLVEEWASGNSVEFVIGTSCVDLWTRRP